MSKGMTQEIHFQVLRMKIFVKLHIYKLLTGCKKEKKSYNIKQKLNVKNIMDESSESTFKMFNFFMVSELCCFSVSSYS